MRAFPLLLVALVAFISLGIVSAAAVIPPTPAPVAEADLLLGQWVIDGKIRVEVSKADGKYAGKVVWMLEPRYPKGHRLAGKPKIDRFNPDPAKRTQPVMGLRVIEGFDYAGNGEWQNGIIYNADDGRTYTSVVRKISNDELRIRGYWMVEALGRTIQAKRYKAGR